ncbi:MAG: hypothetical protein Q7S54_00285 [bacterium]|nr:hypothetical protein [bacterium]
MEPKFQSSFIPRSSLASSASSPSRAGVAFSPAKKSRQSLVGLISALIFALSVILALGVFGYGFYLKYSIDNMAAALEIGRAELEPEKVDELIRLNDRMSSTQNLIGSHLLLTPLFRFLETSTLKTVRFTDFNYAMSGKELELSLRGEARSYSALALQADLFNKSGYLKNITFSDLSLDEKGNVTFSFRAFADKNLFSYQKEVAGNRSLVPPPAATTSTSTSTSTPISASTTLPKTTR